MSNCRQGMCDRCYQKKLRHGDPNFVDPKSRVYDVVMGPNGCQINTKPADTNGYVAIPSPHGQRKPAHVVAWEAVNGPVPAGFVIDHRCHNEAVARGECVLGRCFHRACVNPDHLDAVTHGENIRRAKHAVSTCVRGHSLVDPANLGQTTRQRRCLSCHRIETRMARGKSEAEAAAMEADYLSGKNRKSAPTPAA